MTLVAWAVFVLALGYTIFDGVRRTRGVKDLEGFFAAGRSIPWWAAGLSVMATQLSAITIIGCAGMGYEKGLEWVQFYFALPFAMVILCIWFVPMYRQHPILTAYEFLERRFGRVTRSLTSAVFLVSRCGAFAVVLYAPAVVFSVMTGINIEATVWITGLLTTAYTVTGGIGGVVWADVKQMFVILIAMVICIAMLFVEGVGELGFTGLLRALGAAGRMNAVEVANPDWAFALQVKGAEPVANSFWADTYNLWTGLFGTLFLFLSYFGCDQSQVQSILTSKSVEASRRALLLSAFTKVPLQLLMLFFGGLLFVHQSMGKEPLLFNPRDAAVATAAASPEYVAAAERHAAATAARRQGMIAVAAGDESAVEGYRDAVRTAQAARKAARRDAYREDLAKDANFEVPADDNYIFPHYMFSELPKPLLGLVLAAIFAAAISSAAGALSSLTSATMVDFYRQFAPAAAETKQLRVSRVAMACWGITATGAATWLGNGPLLERVNQVGSMFYGSILGVFVLALAVPRAGGTAASAGLLGGLIVVFTTERAVQIAYLWYNLVGFVGCMAVGGLVAAFRPRR